MTDFVHLHVHSHYSLLNGLTKIKALVKAAKARGFSALALTDYGSMYGAIEFYQACLAEGIKPIIGFEAYIAPRSRLDKDPAHDSTLYHLILLAENYNGYKNLMKLSSFGHLEGFFNGKPRIDKELLRKYHENIIVLSGPIEGEIPTLIKNGEIAKAKAVAREYQEMFSSTSLTASGSDYFYLELEDHPAISGQIEVNTKLIELGKELGIPLVVTRDVHYLNPDDDEAQDILRCIAEGWRVDQPNRIDYRGVDRSFATGDDIAARFRHVPEAIANTIKIAERVNIQIELNKWHFAPVELPPGKTADDVLAEEAHNRVTIYFKEKTAELTERLNYELEIIKTKKYSPYFLCVADFVRYAKDHGIVESTRGSAAGSLVSYVMGITTVDPMRFNLPFERFLNPFRPSPPDVDTDFADDRRDEMIEYVTKKYGADKVAQIITFGTMAARASVRDVGRALGFAYSFCDQVAKLIPQGAQGFPMTIGRALTEEPDLKKLYEQNADVKRLLDLARKVEGCARHTSIHAAGVVIAPTALMDFSPVQYETGGTRITTQYEMKSVEAAGVLKNDFLGIRNLAILGNAVEFVKKTTGQEIDIYNLPLDDAKVYEMLARGETMGVFQLGGSGMTRWLKELKPNRIEDIMAMVALYRPGPMESIPEYIRRKYNPEAVKFFDSRLEKILGASYGLLVYQDDVMLTAIALAGYDWMEADKFRKAMGKKIPEEMAKQKEQFYKGCQEIGKVKKDIVDEIWHAIEPFAAYGFNKCLVGETEIVDAATGAIRTIKEMYEQKSRMSVLSLSGYKKLIKRKIIDIYKNGKKPVWEITIRSGRKITATGNHPFLKFGGWFNLEKLCVGDLIAVPRKIDYRPSADLDSKKLKVLGYLLSEGNLCHPYGVYFYSSVEVEIQDFITAVKSFSNSNVTINRSKSAAAVYVGQINPKFRNNLMLWLKELGLYNKKATEKFIPEFIFKLSPEKIAVLVGSMWQGDGCVHDDKNGQIYYATSSEKLAQQMQHLLLRLDILSTIYTKKFTYRNGLKIGYTINISRYNNLANFAHTVGQHLLPNKKIILNNIIKKNKILNGTLHTGVARGSKDVVPAQILELIRKELGQKGITIKTISQELKIAERLFYQDTKRKGYLRETVGKIGIYLKSTKLLQEARSELYWDEIVSIKSRGMQETYDLTVLGEHNFVANDFVVHNSHAASYGIVAYQTAYLKAHYPVQFMTAILQAEASDLEKVAAIVYECGRMGIEVLPPDINESFKSFAMVSKPGLLDPAQGKPGRIRFGLNAIKNVGEHICEVIYRERKEHGAYQSLENFLERITDKDLNKKSLESLVVAGALDCFGFDRNVLFANSENMLFFYRQARDRELTKQDSLFAATDISLDSKVMLKPAPNATMEQKLTWEKDLLGLYLSAHPLHPFVDALKGVVIPLAEVESAPRDSWVVCFGVVESIKKKITKKGDMMLFVVIQDLSATMELLVFPKTYARTKDLWLERALICIVGKTPREEGENKIFVENAYELRRETISDLARQLALSVGQKLNSDVGAVPEKYLRIILSADELQTSAEPIKTILATHPGDTTVYLQVGTGTIKVGTKVNASEELLSELIKILGDAKVEMF
ncbi:MAG: hypothetical protein A2821_02535 [Candidatus Magasanikbacteria bacterium RIFCSPHIGHO2_01_FULL_41_23]|uniref:DNA-directed DNA polymerase n=1 Tax=Candidatus Magasanikbacteria bacterium RIFCSPLOWO2_01_FULL_40_15 TaxID=1798686 RepID=A0A1F6N2N6_9BACT|nr:MAG: hypothetical protein A2821_02535 [Candidatus Magasanikbacteria bacterium RIFCSPHIGHO2_01_FULL_41_23]OGH66886.1 MAG: hypothetical protein A3C66_02315 [Candidatus Magasanikbacteria bacterium RIFCSPHIGHO2_02_FULL_41_35]OGH74870.1 MAG: hypothetical protein A3F22_04245 [Candidatus Magasanikbacteria bacterium RIFCSPHIGHO2_12_FULL_41_16]OGH78144.1 MAG: hypothetical protein A2983_03665 [Candidatus Magasanikbacteria bacterium RIFCSPLOWO2_01_FULL_40_15]